MPLSERGDWMNRLDNIPVKAKKLVKPSVSLGLAILEPTPAGWLAKAHLLSKNGCASHTETTVHDNVRAAEEHIRRLAKDYPGSGDVPVILLDIMG